MREAVGRFMFGACLGSVVAFYTYDAWTRFGWEVGFWIAIHGIACMASVLRAPGPLDAVEDGLGGPAGR